MKMLNDKVKPIIVKNPYQTHVIKTIVHNDLDEKCLDDMKAISINQNAEFISQLFDWYFENSDEFDSKTLVGVIKVVKGENYDYS